MNGRTPPPGFEVNEGRGEVEPTSQLVSTIRAATTSTSHYGQSYEQESINFPPSPHLVRDSTNTASEGANFVHVGSTFGRTGKRYPPSNNSTISSVTVNGKTYHGQSMMKEVTGSIDYYSGWESCYANLVGLPIITY